MRPNPTLKDYFLIAVLASLLFIPFIGRMHLFDWDEINFAECAREMIVTEDYLSVQIDYRPFWEKPPLFIWMQVLSMKAFGINEFSARFPDAVCGIVTLMLLFRIGSKVRDRRTGSWWAFIYAASILPQLYFHSGIIDPWFNLFIFLSVWNIVQYFSGTPGSGMWKAIRAGIFIGLAVLTKGPAAILILGLVLFVFLLILAWNKIREKEKTPVFFRWTDLAGFAFVALLTGSSWFIAQALNGHFDMVMKFISYQVRLFTIPDAGHGGHWSYHFWVLLAGVFPASVVAIPSFRFRNGEPGFEKAFHRFMLILFWVVLILFSIVKTKIVHYSSLCYFPLTYFAATTVTALIYGEKKWPRSLGVLLFFLTLTIALVAAGLPVAMLYKQQIIDSGLIKDAFAVANLQADVHWSGWEGIGGIVLLLAVVISLILMKKRAQQSLILLFSATLLFAWTTTLIFPYRIEKYSQGAAIEFFQQKSQEHCYVLNAGYFSYAPLFYGKKMPGDVKLPMELLTRRPDRPFYLVLKEPEYDQWKHIIPAMKVLYKKNGFVFLQRVDTLP